MTNLFFAVLILFLAVSGIQATVLSSLSQPRDYTTHRISSYDRSGGNLDGGQDNPLQVGETRTIAEMEGPGEMVHMWFTFAPFDKDTLSNVILRIYWDDEQTPSVESPIGAFFGLGHGKEYSFDSLPISIGNNRGLNCFFPMPFNKSGRVTIENNSHQPINALYFYFNYNRFPSSREDILYFHAQYRQEKPATDRSNFVALDTRGRGHYVGMFYYIRSNAGGWWGEGDDMIYIDGDTYPTLYGTGMEDYFCHAWGMKHEQSFMRFGSPLWELHMVGVGNENTAYRWHLEDAITFKTSIRVTHEKGSNNDRNDDFSSVAFWYQTHPRSPFPPLPSRFDRLSFHDKKQLLLEEERFQEYEDLLTHFIEEAVEPEARNLAVLDLARMLMDQEKRDQAVSLLEANLGPIPVDGFAQEVAQFAEKNELTDLQPPESEMIIVICGDGRPLLTETDGQMAYTTDREHFSPFLYFRVLPDELRDRELDLVLEVEYHDKGDSISVEYNAINDQVFHQTSVQMSGDGGWQTMEIPLEGALLRRAVWCGTDMRITNPDGELTIRKVSIRQK